jgi:hypothetical protein
MVGFFIMAAIRMVPKYLEYLSIKDMVQRVALEHDPGTQSMAQIRRTLAKNFNTSQIYDLKVEEIDIYRKKGKTYIDANYEVRVPMVGRIDAVMKFDDLIYITGTPVSQPNN